MRAGAEAHRTHFSSPLTSQPSLIHWSLHPLRSRGRRPAAASIPVDHGPTSCLVIGILTTLQTSSARRPAS